MRVFAVTLLFLLGASAPAFAASLCDAYFGNFDRDRTAHVLAGLKRSLGYEAESGYDGVGSAGTSPGIQKKILYEAGLYGFRGEASWSRRAFFWIATAHESGHAKNFERFVRDPNPGNAARLLRIEVSGRPGRIPLPLNDPAYAHGFQVDEVEMHYKQVLWVKRILAELKQREPGSPNIAVWEKYLADTARTHRELRTQALEKIELAIGQLSEEVPPSIHLGNQSILDGHRRSSFQIKDPDYQSWGTTGVLEMILPYLTPKGEPNVAREIDDPKYRVFLRATLREAKRLVTSFDPSSLTR